jgi:glycosyltransferase involved in cell wall biosynthesis
MAGDAAAARDLLFDADGARAAVDAPPAGRLLMILHGYFPDEPRVAAEARAARAEGFDVDVIALRRPGELAVEKVEGVTLRRLPVEHRRGEGLAAMAFEYASFTILASVVASKLALRQRYDVVQVHSPPDFLVVAALGPRLRGARIVLDVHDLASDMFAMRFEGRRGARLADAALRALERWAASAASAVLTVHEPYREELVVRGIPAAKISVVMNSLDESLLPSSSPLELDDSFTIFYHGTVTPHYGVRLLVEAAAQLRDSIPDLRVVICGEGDDLPVIRALARELRVDDLLQVSGFLPQVEVLQAARRASVGVVPNLRTRLNRFALSTKLLEYVALGVPVVSADLPTIRKHFSPEEVSFFEPGDASALASALQDVFADPDAARVRAAAARRRYEAYRWEQSRDTYGRVLRRAAFGSGRPATVGPRDDA